MGIWELKVVMIEVKIGHHNSDLPEEKAPHITRVHPELPSKAWPGFLKYRLL